MSAQSGGIMKIRWESLTYHTTIALIFLVNLEFLGVFMALNFGAGKEINGTTSLILFLPEKHFKEKTERWSENLNLPSLLENK